MLQIEIHSPDLEKEVNALVDGVGFWVFLGCDSVWRKV